MSLPWSARQLEWLGEMGFEVLARRGAGDAAAAPAEAARPGAAARIDAGAAVAASPAAGAAAVPPALRRLAPGVELAPLLERHPPRDPASRRALWRALRPLRKAARPR